MTQSIQEILEEFQNLSFPTDGFICPICNYIFESIEGVNLMCKTKACNGVLETPHIYMKRKFKEFLKTKLEQVVAGIPEGEGCRNGDPCYEILEDKIKAYQDEITK